MPNEEASMAKLSEARLYDSLDRLKGYWQCPLVPDVQETFTIATPGGLYTPTRVPLGILNILLPSDAYTRVQEAQLHGFGGRCELLRVGRCDIFGVGRGQLAQYLTLERLEEVGLYDAAHKHFFLD